MLSTPHPSCPLAVTPCLPPQPMKDPATGKSHTHPSLTQSAASTRTPLNHLDPTPSPRMALLLKLKTQGGNECLPRSQVHTHSLARRAQGACNLPALPALMWGKLPVHQVSTCGGQVPTRHSAQQLQGRLESRSPYKMSCREGSRDGVSLGGNKMPKGVHPCVGV